LELAAAQDPELYRMGESLAISVIYYRLLIMQLQRINGRL
jgi:hypothetical protein